jgi:O-antigen/teichoic acid export membrane protein
MKLISLGPLAKNTLLTTAGIGMRTLLQIALFLSVTRTLGANGYGEFISVLAVVGWFMPLVGIGCNAIMMREAGKDSQLLPQLLGRSLVLIIATSFPLIALAIIAAYLILPPEISLVLILCISLSELFCFPLVETCSRAFQAKEKMLCMVLLSSSLIALRLGGFGGFFFQERMRHTFGDSTILEPVYSQR